MAHPKETRDALRRAYIFSNVSLDNAAKPLGVSPATATRWKKDAKESGDDWDVIRSANMLASGAPEDVARSILASLMTQFQATLDKVNSANDIPAQERVTLLASLTDGYSKAIAASKKILPETSQLATSMETMKLFSTFIQEHYPQHLTAFVEVLEAFGPILEKNYG